MIYPDIDYKEWAQLHSITPLHKKCPCCNKEFLTTIPVAINGYRGLQTPDHGCGDDGFVSIFVPVDEKIMDKWKELLFE